MLKILAITLIFFALNPNNKSFGQSSEDSCVWEGYAHNNFYSEIIIRGEISNLDFFSSYPDLERIVFFSRSAKYLNAIDDLGLKNNINLKKLRAGYVEPQNVISRTYLPSVEFYDVYGAYHNLDYLSLALPSLKGLYFTPNSRENLSDVLENISKLEYLEELIISPWEGELTLTIDEIKAFSKMYNLKSLIISFYVPRHLEKLEFDMQKITLLCSLMPNTEIRVNKFRIQDFYP